MSWSSCHIVLHKGLPFELKLPASIPLDYSKMSKEQFDAEMEKGFADYEAGRTVSVTQVREEMKKYGGRDIEEHLSE